MKKLLCVILTVLVLLPLSVFASAAAPEEPVLENTNTVGYIAHGSTGVAKPSKSEYDGFSPEKSKPSWGIDYGGIMEVVQMGGTIVSTGKAFVGSSFSFDNLGTVVMTGVDPKTGVDYRDYKIYADEAAKTGNGSQRGSFINTAEITIIGNLIFDKIYILTRLDKQGDFHVVNGGKLVLTDSVQFFDMKDTDGVKAPVLNLEKNGVAFLHAVGFSDYQGSGTIVLDKKLIDDGKITLEAFESFKGKVLDETGAVLFDGKASADTATAPDTGKAPETTEKSEVTRPILTTNEVKGTQKAPDTAKSPETTNSPETTGANADTDEGGINPIVWIVVGVCAAAAIVVVAVVVTKKKKAN